MLTKEDKIRTFEAYIASERFGRDTWTTIHIFGSNVDHGIKVLQLLFVLIGRLDRNNVDISNIPKDDVIRIKQQIYLEIILKLVTLIESTLVLVATLGKGYAKVTRNMTYYDINYVKDIVRKFANKSNRNVNMRRALGLANPAKLQLSSEERRLLLRVYEETISHTTENLRVLANFYERYRIVYGKSKHGLTIQTGISLISDNDEIMPNHTAQFNKSLLICYDRKERLDMPSGTLELSSTDIRAGDYYNALALLNFNEKLDTEIKEAMQILEKSIKYVCENHMIHATNCGENYIPCNRVKDTPDTFDVIFLGDTKIFTQHETKSLQGIFNKIVGQMNLMNVGTIVSAEYHISEAVIRELIMSDSVVNIWLSPHHKSADQSKSHR